MPVFGFSIEKIDDRLDPWVNTYYTVVADLSSARSICDYIAAGEPQIHSLAVTITGAHIWEVGNRGNFTNRSYDFIGVMDDTAALPPWFTAEINLTGDAGYPGYKRYRTRIGRSFYDGPDWNATYQGVLATFAEYLDESPNPLSARTGRAFNGASANPIPAPLQLSKQWYNRSSS